MTDVQFIVETSTDPNSVTHPEAGPGISIPDPSQAVLDKPTGAPAQVHHIPGPSTDTLDPAVVAVMSTELIAAKETIGSLTNELARVRSRNLLLEDQASSGKKYYHNFPFSP